MSQSWNIAVLGACGAVGQALVELLARHRFPVSQLSLLSRNEHTGEQQRFAGKTLTIQDASEFDWSQADLAFFVAGSQASMQYAQTATDAGCLVIDSGGAFSLTPDVPLIVPGVNDAMLAEYRNHNLVALAGSMSCQLLLALQPLMRQSALTAIQISALLPASQQGKGALQALAGQSAHLLNGQPISEQEPFGGQLAFNILPFASDDSGSVPEERRLVDEVRKVLQQADLPVCISCFRVPVFYGHEQMVSVALHQPLSIQESQQAWQGYPYIDLLPSTELPSPVAHATDSTQLTIGCIRQNYGLPQALQFCSVADNVRFGGALMALQVAERLTREYLV